jgi:tetratricopeptide (TPR) repeat protein
VRGWLLRIGIHTSRAELVLAEEAADAALAAIPDQPLIMFARAHVLFLARRFDAAVEQLRALTTIAPEDPAAWFLLGQTLLLAFREAEAIEPFATALACVERLGADPSYLVQWTAPNFATGEQLRDCDFLSRGGEHRRAIIEALGHACFFAGRLGEACDWFRRAIALGAGPEIRYRLGVALYLDGALDEASGVLEMAFEAAPLDSRPAFVLALVLTQLGTPDAADVVLRRIVATLVSRLQAVKQPPSNGGSGPMVLLPWNLRAYVPYGLIHPLLDQYCQAPYPDVQLSYSAPPASPADALNAARAAVRDFETTSQYLETSCPQITRGRIFQFLESRHLLSQMLLTSADLTVSHTSPFNLLGRPWAVHVENPITLFQPFVTYGRVKHTDVRQVPAYWLLKAYFEHESCRAIFSHIPETCEAIARLFDSELIASRVTFVPLGLADLPARRPRPSRASRDRCRILFTSSFNQQDSSFYSRGGLYVVSSFLELADEHHELELVLRASIPGDLPARLQRRIFEHPRITLLSRGVGEQELADLFASADIFPLVSYTIHCLSLLRAMANGSACVVSDAPDYDGFIEDGRTALVVRGRRGQTYERDPATLMIQDDFPMLHAFDAEYGRRVTHTLRTLVADPSARAALGENARAHVETHLGLGAAREAFGTMLRRSIGRYSACATPAA